LQNARDKIVLRFTFFTGQLILRELEQVLQVVHKRKRTKDHKKIRTSNLHVRQDNKFYIIFKSLLMPICNFYFFFTLIKRLNFNTQKIIVITSNFLFQNQIIAFHDIIYYIYYMVKERF